MSKKILSIIIGFTIVIVGGFVIFLYSSFTDINKSPIDINEAKNSDKPQEEQQVAEEVNDTDEVVQPVLIAGENSSYYEFTQSAYDEAILSEKIVFLEFYSNWCPICRIEQEDIVEVFNDLQRDDVIGFRANFKDDETSEEERLLAVKFEVTYQHTKFLLVNGKEVLRSGDPWTTARFVSAIDSISL